MELSVIIVNHNARADLENCLSSLYQNTTLRPLEVLVVDNASRDGSLEMLARQFPEVHVTPSSENVGFATANNMAMREAHGRFLLLLNNDTLVRPGAVDTILRMMRERPELGVLGPLLRNEDGSIQISYGRTLSLHAELLQKLLSARYEAGNRIVHRHVERRSKKEAYPDWVSGACMMLRADVAERVGFFDEQFFMYAEDVDLCQRVRNLGYRVFYTPQAEIVHLKGRSRASNTETVGLEYRRSQLTFYSKHYGRGRLRLLKVYLLAKTLVGWVARGRAQRPFHSRVLRLVWDFTNRCRNGSRITRCKPCDP